MVGWGWGVSSAVPPVFTLRGSALSEPGSRLSPASLPRRWVADNTPPCVPSLACPPAHSCQGLCVETEGVGDPLEVVLRELRIIWEKQNLA